MRLNLDGLRAEIQEYLEKRGIVIFHGFPRGGDPSSSVFWDTERHPDFREFLAAAEAAGVRLVTLYSREMDEDLVEEAMDQLSEASALDREERRAIELRLKEVRGYCGFTCQIELSFDLAPRVYIFDVRTEWFDDLNELTDRIESAFRRSDDNGGPLGGGYFSRN